MINIKDIPFRINADCPFTKEVFVFIIIQKLSQRFLLLSFRNALISSLRKSTLKELRERKTCTVILHELKKTSLLWSEAYLTVEKEHISPDWFGCTNHALLVIARIKNNFYEEKMWHFVRYREFICSAC